jgi:hypothetical protein
MRGTIVLLDALEQHRATHALFVPALLNLMVQTPGAGERDYSHLKHIV